MASKVRPYEICLRSADREPGGNPSDYRIKLGTSQQRLPVVQVSVATLELPTPQRSVDPRWGCFYWSEAVDLPIDADERSIRVSLNGSDPHHTKQVVATSLPR